MYRQLLSGSTLSNHARRESNHWLSDLNQSHNFLQPEFYDTLFDLVVWLHHTLLFFRSANVKFQRTTRIAGNMLISAHPARLILQYPSQIFTGIFMTGAEKVLVKATGLGWKHLHLFLPYSVFYQLGKGSRKQRNKMLTCVTRCSKGSWIKCLFVYSVVSCRLDINQRFKNYAPQDLNPTNPNNSQGR